MGQRYADLMAEAAAEYAAAMARPRPVLFSTGDEAHGTFRVWVQPSRRPSPAAVCTAPDCERRAVRRGLCETCRVAARAAAKPPCWCGAPYFAAGQCRPHYFRAYNAARPRRGTGRHERRLAA